MTPDERRLRSVNGRVLSPAAAEVNRRLLARGEVARHRHALVWLVAAEFDDVFAEWGTRLVPGEGFPVGGWRVDTPAPVDRGTAAEVGGRVVRIDTAPKRPERVVVERRPRPAPVVRPAAVCPSCRATLQPSGRCVNRCQGPGA